HLDLSAEVLLVETKSLRAIAAEVQIRVQLHLDFLLARETGTASTSLTLRPLPRGGDKEVSFRGVAGYRIVPGGRRRSTCGLCEGASRRSRLWLPPFRRTTRPRPAAGRSFL